MHNVSTIYRFNTPFLNIKDEKKGLLGVIKKVEKSIEFDGISFKKEVSSEGNYYKVTLELADEIGLIEFFYVSKLKTNIYHLPIFKLNIFLNDVFILNNKMKIKTVKFLNNIFECFDGLNEKEYLIDIDNTLYYKNNFFSPKVRPSYDFSNIDEIKSNFEDERGMELLENFILKFQNKTFVLTKENAKEYHKLHGVLLYFIYLVFLINQTLEKTNKMRDSVNNIEVNGIYEGNLILMKQRLNYINDINEANFEKYKARLELFFKMF